MNIDDKLIQKIMTTVNNKSITEDELFDIMYEESLDIMQFPEMCEKLLINGVSIISEKPVTDKSVSVLENVSDNPLPKKQFTVKDDANNVYIKNEKIEDDISIYGRDDSQNQKSSYKLRLLKFSEKRSYQNTIPSSFSYQKRKEIFVESWIDLYVKILSILAKKSSSKLSAWAGMGDLYSKRHIDKDSELYNLGYDLYVDVSESSADRIVENLWRYINICDDNISNFIIYYREIGESTEVSKNLLNTNNDNQVVKEENDIYKLVDDSFKDIISYCEKILIQIKKEAHLAIDSMNIEESKMKLENAYQMHLKINEQIVSLNKIKGEMLSSETIKRNIVDNLSDQVVTWHRFNQEMMLNIKFKKIMLNNVIYDVCDISDTYIKIIDALIPNDCYKANKLIHSPISKGFNKVYFTDIPYKKYRRIGNTHYYMLIDLTDSEMIKIIMDVLVFFNQLNHFKIGY